MILLSLFRVNCAFYHKIGACRHGNGCSRVHNRPQYSPTVLIPHMYRNPKAAVIEMNVYGQKAALDEDKAQKEFEEFYEEVYDELSQYGSIEEMHVCDNFCEHMIGNVYVMYEDEEDAMKALNALQGRFYAGIALQPEFSPVTDFKAATCRQFEMNQCTRGGYCNFMHLKEINPELRRKLFGTKKYNLYNILFK